MKAQLSTFATWKRIDLIAQMIVFPAMLYAVCYTSLAPFGMYVMAVAQLVSCIAWTVAAKGIVVMRGRRLLQPVFLIVAGILLLLLSFSPDGFFGISWFIMLWLGPILGIWYFVLTAREIAFYSKLGEKLSLR